METLLPSSRKDSPTPAPIPRMIYGALVRVLGRERAEIVDFYIDTRLAAADPDRYEQAVVSLLGEGGRLVIRGIKSELAKSGRVHAMANDSFSVEVRAVEKALVRLSQDK
jgi:hypothetical protein